MAESTRKWLNLSAYNLHLFMPADSAVAYIQTTAADDAKALAAIKKLVADNGFAIADGNVIVPAKELMKIATSLVEREVVTLPISDTQKPKDIVAAPVPAEDNVTAESDPVEVADETPSDEAIADDQVDQPVESEENTESATDDSEIVSQSETAESVDHDEDSTAAPEQVSSPASRFADMPPKSDSTDFRGSELLTLGSNDFRGMEFAIVLKNGRVHTAGGTPLLGDPNHPTSHLDYYIEMTDKLGADLWVVPNIARKARTDADLNGSGLIFGYTWSQINAMQQSVDISYTVKSEIPEGAVLFYSATPLVATESSVVDKSESSPGTSQEDEVMDETIDSEPAPDSVSEADTVEDSAPVDEPVNTSAPIEKHQDVGRKVGGAKKDLRGASLADFESAYQEVVGFIEDEDLQNANENLKSIQESAQKSNVWPAIDWKKEKANGMSPRVAAFIKTVRDALDPKPEVDLLRTKSHALENEVLKVLKYIEIVSRYRDSLKDLKTDEQLDSMIASIKLMVNDDLRYRSSDEDYKAKYAKEIATLPFVNMTDATIEAFGQTHPLRNYDVGRKFGRKYNYALSAYNAEQAISETNRNIRKASFRHDDQWSFVIRPSRNKADTDNADKKPQDPTPIHLTHIDRKGKEWREDNRNVTGKDLMETFGFSGIEYGNWLPNKERQVVLNYTYDAFMDLANVMGVSPKVMSLEGTLALAFGSRGNGGKNSASAHYEPTRKVINLTRIKGAGTAAHEWFHALDDYLGSKLTLASSRSLGAARDNYITHNQTMYVDDRKAHGPGLADLEVVIQKVIALNKAMLTKPAGYDKAKQDSIVKAEKMIDYTKHGEMWVKSYIEREKNNCSLNFASKYILNKLVNQKELIKFIVEDAFAKRLEGELADSTPDTMMAFIHASYVETVTDALKDVDSDMLAKMHSDLIDEITANGARAERIQEVKDMPPKLDKFLGYIKSRLDSFQTVLERRRSPEHWFTKEGVRAYGKTEIEQINQIAYARYAVGVRLMKDIINGDRDHEFNAAVVETDYVREAVVLDSKRKEKYWTRQTELGARAFEAFTMDALAKDNLQNDYLTAHAAESRYADKERYKGNPYPVGEERQEINQAFYGLNAAISEYAIAIDMEGKAEERIKQYIHEDEEDTELRMRA